MVDNCHIIIYYTYSPGLLIIDLNTQLKKLTDNPTLRLISRTDQLYPLNEHKSMLIVKLTLMHWVRLNIVETQEPLQFEGQEFRFWLGESI